jgi:hypothetical protein
LIHPGSRISSIASFKHFTRFRRCAWVSLVFFPFFLDFFLYCFLLFVFYELVSSLWTGSLVSKLNVVWILFFFLFFLIYSFQFYPSTFNLLETGFHAFFFLFFYFGLSRSNANGHGVCRLTQVESYFFLLIF